jgi:hypothetical protein
VDVGTTSRPRQSPFVRERKGRSGRLSEMVAEGGLAYKSIRRVLKGRENRSDYSTELLPLLHSDSRSMGLSDTCGFSWHRCSPICLYSVFVLPCVTYRALWWRWFLGQNHYPIPKRSKILAIIHVHYSYKTAPVIPSSLHCSVNVNVHHGNYYPLAMADSVFSTTTTIRFTSPRLRTLLVASLHFR